jgi:hypothetical protein
MKQLLCLTVLVLGVAIAFAAPSAGAGTTGGSVSCVMGDVGCEFASGFGFAGLDCSPWFPIQPVTCVSSASAGFVPRTTVLTGVNCVFFWPLLPPDLPPGFSPTIWSTQHGTAILRPNGSITVHCPHGSIITI